MLFHNVSSDCSTWTNEMRLIMYFVAQIRLLERNACLGTSNMWLYLVNVRCHHSNPRVLYVSDNQCDLLFVGRLLRYGFLSLYEPISLGLSWHVLLLPPSCSVCDSSLNTIFPRLIENDVRIDVIYSCIFDCG